MNQTQPPRTADHPVKLEVIILDPNGNDIERIVVLDETSSAIDGEDDLPDNEIMEAYGRT
jgi:hypothetical protein